jgi:hypothetical protein
MTRQRIAIVGGGGAGLCTAWLLQHSHEVTLFEKEGHLGGHARTVDVAADGGMVNAETGFKYFLDGSHETLLALMRLLGLRPERRTSSLTVDDRRHGRVLVLPPRSPLQAARLLRHLPLVRALRRMMAGADGVVARRDWSKTLADEARDLGLSDRFVSELLLPSVASSWGTTVEQMAAFPAYDVMKNLWKGAAGFLRAARGRVGLRARAGRRHHRAASRPGTPSRASPATATACWSTARASIRWWWPRPPGWPPSCSDPCPWPRRCASSAGSTPASSSTEIPRSCPAPAATGR